MSGSPGQNDFRNFCLGNETYQIYSTLKKIVVKEMDRTEKKRLCPFP